MFDRILFPNDTTDHADRVLEYALDVAETRDATLHAFSVVDDRAFLLLDDDRVDEVRHEMEAAALDAVEETVATTREAGVAVDSDVDVGDPAECILEYVDANDVDLVVMGTSGDSHERNVVGSVSQRVVEQSPVPVMTVGLQA